MSCLLVPLWCNHLLFACSSTGGSSGMVIDNSSSQTLVSVGLFSLLLGLELVIIDGNGGGPGSVLAAIILVIDADLSFQDLLG